jgi:hypothetical protein
MAARTRPTSWGIMITLAVAVALTSCSSDPGGSSKSPSSSSSFATSADPTPSATSLSPVEADKRSASRAVVQLWSELDKLAGDPNLTLTSLAQVARGQALAQWQSNLSDQRARHWKQDGAVVVASSDSSYVGNNIFQTVACIDVSKVLVVDAAGKSVLSAGRPSRTKYTYEVTNTVDGFFVTKDTMSGVPC